MNYLKIRPCVRHQITMNNVISGSRKCVFRLPFFQCMTQIWKLPEISPLPAGEGGCRLQVFVIISRFHRFGNLVSSRYQLTRTASRHIHATVQIHHLTFFPSRCFGNQRVVQHIFGGLTFFANCRATVNTNNQSGFSLSHIQTMRACRVSLLSLPYPQAQCQCLGAASRPNAIWGFVPTICHRSQSTPSLCLCLVRRLWHRQMLCQYRLSIYRLRLVCQNLGECVNAFFCAVEHVFGVCRHSMVGAISFN